MTHTNQNIKHIRTYNGITQKQMADILNITLRNYQRYESGEVDPPSSKTKAIADYFDVPTDFLLGRGIYANWQEIMDHKDIIISAVTDQSPILRGMHLNQMDEKALISIFGALFEKVEFNGDKLQLYPKIPLENLNHRKND